MRIGGETLLELLPVAPSTPLTPSSSAPWWRGSSLAPRLWDYGSNLYQTFFCASMIRATWASNHDCDHICITPMVDFLFVRWFMRCKDVYILDVWVYACVTPFLYACSDQTSILGLVWACVYYWSNLVVSLGKWQKSMDYYGFYRSMVARKDYLAYTSNDRNNAFLARMHICFQNHVTVLSEVLY
jgi:hypothetical protein